jgi:hypothetical protein
VELLAKSRRRSPMAGTPGCWSSGRAGRPAAANPAPREVSYFESFEFIAIISYLLGGNCRSPFVAGPIPPNRVCSQGAPATRRGCYTSLKNSKSAIKLLLITGGTG